MAFQKYLIFIVGTIFIVVVGVSAECEAGWREYYGNCYYISDQRHNYHDSEVICAARNATIWVYHSQEELKWVSSLASNGPRIMYWLGLKLVNHHWTWIDGTPYIKNNVKWYHNREGNKNARNLCSGMYSYQPYVGQVSQQNCRTTWGIICVRPNNMLDVCDLANGWRYIDGWCLRWYDTPATWFDARQTCQSQQGDLTMYKNYNQLLNLFDIIPCSSKENMAWIGLSDTAHPRTWRWINNDTLRYQRWYSYGNRILQNGSTCAVTDPTQSWGWRGYTCDTQWKFICNRSVGVCPNGWLANQDRCYQAQVTPALRKTWFDAKTYCAAMGTSLLIINSDTEQQFIAKTLKDLKVTRSWLAFSVRATAKPVSTNTQVRATAKPVSTNTQVRATAKPVSTNTQGTIHPTPHLTSSPCADTRADCKTLGAFYCKAPYLDFARQFCKKSCNLCGVRATAKPVSTNTQVTGTLVPETCTDRLSNCANYSRSVCSGIYAPWAKDNCQRFCGFCTPLYTTGPPPCVDHLPNCPSFQKSSCTGSYIGWAKNNCRKYCGYCDVNQSDVPYWTDGRAVVNASLYQHWATGYPHANPKMYDCGLISTGGTDARWSNSYCFNLNVFVCEMKITDQPFVPTPAPVSSHCDTDWVLFNNHCYYFGPVRNQTLKSWGEASFYCKATGGDLVVIGDPNEMSFITVQQRSIVTAWIGLKYDAIAGKLMWVDHTVPGQNSRNETNFYPGEPDDLHNGQECIRIVGGRRDYSGSWDDGNCSLPQGFICEKTALAGQVAGPTTLPPANIWSAWCGPNWVYNSITSVCYQVVMNSPKTWALARADCTQKGGDLASISGLREQNFIQGMLGTGQYAAIQTNLWIGATDQSREGGWMWTDNSPFRFLNWHRGEPNNMLTGSLPEDCGELVPGWNYQWNDQKCDFEQLYICKKPAHVATGFALTPPTAAPLTKSCVGEAMLSGTYSLVDSHAFRASTIKDYRHLPIKSRLLPGARGAWSAANNNPHQWISATFFNTIVFVGVTTAGRSGSNEWVTMYKIQYQDSYYAEWLTYNSPPNKPKVFVGNTDATTPVTNKLMFPVEAKTVRLLPVEWHNGISLRWEILGCVEESCHPDYAVSGPIVADDHSLYASSAINSSYAAPAARLSTIHANTTVSCWRPLANDMWPFIQVDLRKMMIIRGVTIRGNPAASEWVTSFEVRIGDQTPSWSQYQEPYGTVKTIQGNQNNLMPVTYIFKAQIKGRYVRILPKTWNTGGNIALAFDVLVCPYGCTGIPMISGSVPLDDSKLTASTMLDGNHGAFRARLHQSALGGYAGAWSPLFNDRHQYIQVDLGYTIKISGIATRGASDSQDWVQSYQLSYSDGGTSWTSCFEHSQKPWIFEGNWNNQMTRKHDLLIPFTARFVRLWPRTYNNRIALRWELYGCPGASSFTQVGCFADNRHAHDLPFEPYTDPNVGMWPPMCVDHCFRNGYLYAGIQHIYECYCGNSYGKYGPATDCHQPCIPNTGSFCGGPSSNLIYTTGLTPQFKVCPSQWDVYRHQCYVLLLDRRSWYDARADCKKAGADLSSPNSEQEKDFVLSLLQAGGGTDAWIGLNDIDDENLFQWVAGGPVKYTNWNLNQPRHTFNVNEDCVTMTTQTGGWQDEDCDTPHQYVCQMDKHPSQVPSPTPDVAGCPHGWDGYRWSCYLYADAPRTRSDAYYMCRTLTQRGTLVHVEDRYEQAYLASMLGVRTGLYWTAITDMYNVGTYGYNDRTGYMGNMYLSFSNWAPNKPDSVNNCVAMGSSNTSGLWYNKACTSKLGTICETMRIGYTSPPPPPVTTPPILCDPGLISTGLYCYQVKSRPPHLRLTWREASLDCSLSRGSLAAFHNVSDMDAVWRQGLVGQSSGYWIGLNGRDLHTGYMWPDKSPTQYFNWAQGQPNPRSGRAGCVDMDPATSRWADQECGDRRSWICMVRRGSHLWVVPSVPGPPAGNGSLCTPGTGWSYYHGHCYYGNSGDGNDGRTWRQARKYCQQQGGDLASITWTLEQAFIYRTLLKNVTTDRVWIGLNELDSDRGFRWSDGSSMSYLNWALGEPNNFGDAEDCVALNLRNGRWNDVHCGHRAGFVCDKYVGSIATPATPTRRWLDFCPRGFTRLYNRCYLVYEAAVNWTTARAACKNQGYDLASVMSGVENAFLTTLLANKRVSPWLGLIKQQNQEFMWINQDDVVYTNFAYGHPSGNGGQSCVQMLGNDKQAGQWSDKPCETGEGYVCMITKDPGIPTPEPIPSICDTKQNQTQFANACYLYVPQALTWAAAEAHCNSQGADLTSINSVYEQAWMYVKLAKVNVRAAWTGLGDRKQSGVYTWVDGWPVMYTNWDTGEPNRGPGEGCVQINQTGRWSDVNCNTTLPSVCKISHGTPPLTPSPPNGTCDLGWYPFGGQCYLLSANQPRSALDAMYTCRQLGASLVSIHNATVNAFLVTSMVKLAQTAQSFWTSLHRSLDSSYMWVDGSPLQYTNWRPGQPSTRGVGGIEENCGEVILSDGRWNDEDCSSQRAYVCEKQKAIDDSSAHLGTVPGQVIKVPTPIPQSIPPILPSQIVPTLHRTTTTTTGAGTPSMVTPPTQSGHTPSYPAQSTTLPTQNGKTTSYPAQSTTLLTQNGKTTSYPAQSTTLLTQNGKTTSYPAQSTTLLTQNGKTTSYPAQSTTLLTQNGKTTSYPAQSTTLPTQNGKTTSYPAQSTTLLTQNGKTTSYPAQSTTQPRPTQTQGTGQWSLGTNMGTSTQAVLNATPAASTVLGMSSGTFAGIIIGAIIALLLAAGIALYWRRNTAQGAAARFGIRDRGFDNKTYRYDRAKEEIRERVVDNGTFKYI